MRGLLIALAVALLLPMGVSAQVKRPIWTCGLDALFDAVTLCRLAPEPGMALYVTDVVAQSNDVTAALFTIYHGKSVATGGGADCLTDQRSLSVPGFNGTQTTRWSANVPTVRPTVMSFRVPLRVPPGRDLCIGGDASFAGTYQLIGYVAP